MAIESRRVEAFGCLRKNLSTVIPNIKYKLAFVHSSACRTKESNFEGLFNQQSQKASSQSMSMLWRLASSREQSIGNPSSSCIRNTPPKSFLPSGVLPVM